LHALYRFAADSEQSAAVPDRLGSLGPFDTVTTNDRFALATASEAEAEVRVEECYLSRPVPMPGR
jgi:hypothetical protein